MTEVRRAYAGSAGRRARAERILDAAAELLRQHGYRRVSIEDVAVRAGVGKGTVYLHWKTREALFWAVLQRETVRLLEDLVHGLSEDAELALPHRLMPAIFLEVVRRPLVKAVLLSDAEVLGALARDESVAAAQRELAGNPDYLGLLARHGLLRPGLSPAAAGHILGSVMRGFFADQDADQDAEQDADQDAEQDADQDAEQDADQDTDPRPGPGRRLPAAQRADLLAEVLARTLETGPPFPAAAVAALGAEVSELFRTIISVQRTQLERAY